MATPGRCVNIQIFPGFLLALRHYLAPGRDVPEEYHEISGNSSAISRCEAAGAANARRWESSIARVAHGVSAILAIIFARRYHLELPAIFHRQVMVGECLPASMLCRYARSNTGLVGQLGLRSGPAPRESADRVAGAAHDLIFSGSDSGNMATPLGSG